MPSPGEFTTHDLLLTRPDEPDAGHRRPRDADGGDGSGPGAPRPCAETGLQEKLLWKKVCSPLRPFLQSSSDNLVSILSRVAEVLGPAKPQHPVSLTPTPLPRGGEGLG